MVLNDYGNIRRESHLNELFEIDFESRNRESQVEVLQNPWVHNSKATDGDFHG